MSFIVDFDCTQFYWELFDIKNNIIKSVPFYRSAPGDLLYPIFFNSYAWTSDEELVIKDPFEEILFVTNTATGDIRIELRPDSRSEHDLRMKLKAFDCTTSDAERIRLMGFLFG